MEYADQGLQRRELRLEYYVQIAMSNAAMERYTPITIQ